MGIKVGIIGASGYTGQELIRILHYHPEAELCYVTSRRYSGKQVKDVFPQFSSIKEGDLKFEEPNIQYINSELDLVFLAVPHGQAMQYVRELSCRVIDLSADYRIKDRTLYEEWYHTEHIDEGTLKEAVYGLCEVYRNEIRAARIIANPGCYPTSILLPLIPLTREGVLSENPIFINSFSGLSGAGINPSDKTHFVNVNENLKPYAVGSHRHTPEIKEQLAFNGLKQAIYFTPYLIPVDRGIMSVINFSLREGIKKQDLLQIYEDYYGPAPFVDFQSEVMPDIKTVRNTNKCVFGVEIFGERDILLVSVIDNILKGASGQAVQNMNIMFGFDEAMGLDFLSFK